MTSNVIVTRSAERFVTLEAIRQLATGVIARDDWNDPLFVRGFRHLEEISECFGVFPASLNSAVRLADGVCDTPTMMTLQMTSKPIGVCSAFPGSNPIIDDKLSSLRKRVNVALADAGPAMRTSSGVYEGSTGFSIPALFAAINAADSATTASPAHQERPHAER